MDTLPAARNPGDEDARGFLEAFQRLSPPVQALVWEFVEVAAAMYPASEAARNDDDSVRLRTIRLRAGLLRLDAAFWHDREDP